MEKEFLLSGIVMGRNGAADSAQWPKWHGLTAQAARVAQLVGARRACASVRSPRSGSARWRSRRLHAGARGGRIWRFEQEKDTTHAPGKEEGADTHQCGGSTAKAEMGSGRRRWSFRSHVRWPVAMRKGSYSFGRWRGRLEVDQTKEKGVLARFSPDGGEGGHDGPKSEELW
jgi:hypothetical protein